MRGTTGYLHNLVSEKRFHDFRLHAEAVENTGDNNAKATSGMGSINVVKCERNPNRAINLYSDSSVDDRGLV